MKNKTKTQLLWVALVVLVVVIGYMWYNPQIVEVPVEVPVMVTPPRPVRTQEIRREPEFRGPPIKQYKPGRMQQMGILVGENGETLPLYGKEVRGRRDRYHYYTTTGGENLYPIPVTHDGRDCVDDIGCQELYGNESVTVTGKTGSFNVTMYRTDDFF
ncbi:hypothetical protein MpV1_190 [Micromonas sp. RCC1109 virus MpV1]|uniref:hypothetical protein n=1 Tax=Micromonas sp. RCC1109 virus MpV1 TaxID=880161 RepID=UPI0001EF44D7|nr:hypothetical protein MpV1_190 [Micromonas sp. RCC1109 virus MpV1]ADQ91113.1 hypothetical protein MpV1_190 [Micromonas sp. RCC1109 virus MpV1]